MDRKKRIRKALQLRAEENAPIIQEVSLASYPKLFEQAPWAILFCLPPRAKNGWFNYDALLYQFYQFTRRPHFLYADQTITFACLKKFSDETNKPVSSQTGAGMQAQPHVHSLMRRQFENIDPRKKLGYALAKLSAPAHSFDLALMHAQKGVVTSVSMTTSYKMAQSCRNADTGVKLAKESFTPDWARLLREMGKNGVPLCDIDQAVREEVQRQKHFMKGSAPDL